MRRRSPQSSSAVEAQAPVPRITLGIDEAGRGPAIGPMVLTLVALDVPSAIALRRRGLADSKRFAGRPDAMRELDAQIRKRAHFVGIRSVSPEEIDARRKLNELNALERELAAVLVNEAIASLAARGLRASRIIADGKQMFASLRERFEEFESHDRADVKHAAVSAASIIAKVVREHHFADIRGRYEREFGPIGGGGYDNNQTRRWLRRYVEKHRCLPVEARRSWPYAYLSDLLVDENPSPRTREGS